MTRRSLGALLPAALRPAARRTRLAALDAWDVATGRRQPMVPPRRHTETVGGYDFLEVGRHLAELTIELGGLRPEGRVLDVGCGVGRLAVPLTRHVTTGRYEGFDLHRWGIRWCQREITARHPNFGFTLVDLRNDHYNPDGAVDPERFAFPYADGAFDLVFASSLFTHLSPGVCARYLRESARVLAPGGRLLASFFLLNDANRPGSNRPESALRFPASDGISSASNPKDPEAAIAFEQAWLESALADAGLVLDAVHPGTWPGRPDGRSFQDFLLARKNEGTSL